MDDVKKKKLTEYLYNPNAKPAKELSEHDQQMIKLGWDAARSSKPSDDGGLREKIAKILAFHKHGGIKEDLYPHWIVDGITDAKEIMSLFGDIRGHERERMLEEYQTLFQFAEKVAIAMDELKSSHAFFIIQQAFGDEDWDSSQDILDTVIAQSKALKGEKNDM